MIGCIRGEVQNLTPQQVCILPASGVGYDIYINEKTYSELVQRSDVDMYIYHHITENAQSLFGFMSGEEKNLFLELIKISGVGGKVALQILMLGEKNLISAIQSEDKKMIESIKGIGKKMAEKIILELKDKDFIKNVVVGATSVGNNPPRMRHFPQIIETLVNMGYNKIQVEKVLGELPEGMQNPDDILPYVIKNM